MPSTILDSAVFRDIFTTPAMRARVVGRKPRAEISRFRGGAGAGARQARHHPEERRRARSSSIATPSMIDMAKLKEATERIGYPVLPVVQQLVKLCKNGLGEWSHWGATTQDITDTATVLQIREALDIIERDLNGHLRRARQARQEIPRHADGRPQQSAAGGADHLRLQDGDLARRLRAPQAAPEGAAPARAGRRIRRRRRHAVLARQGRARSAGRADEGAQARPARDLLAHRARPHRRGRLLPRPRHRHLRQDRLRREAADADRGGRSLRAVPRGPRLVLDHAAKAQSDLVGLHHRADRDGEAARGRTCWKPWSRTTSAPPARGRSNGSRCRKSSCSRPARWRRRASWSKACRSTKRRCARTSTSPRA